MSTIKIEKGVPIPDRGQGRPSIYPWNDMEVGDSFFAKGKSAKKFSGVAAKAGIIRGWKFSIRTVEGGCRVWRVK